MLHRMICIRLSGLEQISWGAASTCPLAAKAIRAMARLRGGAFTIAVTVALLCVIATRSSAHPAKGQVDAWLAHARAARQGMAVMALGFAGHDQQAAMCQRHGLRARAGLLALEREPPFGAEAERRSEERRVGKECVSTCRSRGTPDP